MYDTYLLTGHCSYGMWRRVLENVNPDNYLPLDHSSVIIPSGHFSSFLLKVCSCRHHRILADNKACLTNSFTALWCTWRSDDWRHDRSCTPEGNLLFMWVQIGAPRCKAAAMWNHKFNKCSKLIFVSFDLCTITILLTILCVKKNYLN